jgi:hypothetical protein
LGCERVEKGSIMETTILMSKEDVDKLFGFLITVPNRTFKLGACTKWPDREIIDGENVLHIKVEDDSQKLGSEQDWSQKLKKLDEPILQVQIIDSFRFHEYEKLMDEVNTFIKENDVVSVSHSQDKDQVIYSIIYKTKRA